MKLRLFWATQLSRSENMLAKTFRLYRSTRSGGATIERLTSSTQESRVLGALFNFRCCVRCVRVGLCWEPLAHCYTLFSIPPLNQTYVHYPHRKEGEESTTIVAPLSNKHCTYGTLHAGSIVLLPIVLLSFAQMGLSISIYSPSNHLCSLPPADCPLLPLPIAPTPPPPTPSSPLVLISPTPPSFPSPPGHRFNFNTS